MSGPTNCGHTKWRASLGFQEKHLLCLGNGNLLESQGRGILRAKQCAWSNVYSKQVRMTKSGVAWQIKEHTMLTGNHECLKSVFTEELLGKRQWFVRDSLEWWMVLGVTFPDLPSLSFYEAVDQCAIPTIRTMSYHCRKLPDYTWLPQCSKQGFR